jgi:hypothetical protein
MAIGTDQMIVLFESIGLFILGKILPKLVLANQITFHQQIQ